MTNSLRTIILTAVAFATIGTINLNAQTAAQITARKATIDANATLAKAQIDAKATADKATADATLTPTQATAHKATIDANATLAKAQIDAKATADKATADAGLGFGAPATPAAHRPAPAPKPAAPAPAVAAPTKEEKAAARRTNKLLAMIGGGKFESFDPETGDPVVQVVAKEDSVIAQVADMDSDVQWLKKNRGITTDQATGLISAAAAVNNAALLKKIEDVSARIDGLVESQMTTNNMVGTLANTASYDRKGRENGVLNNNVVGQAAAANSTLQRLRRQQGNGSAPLSNAK